MVISAKAILRTKVDHQCATCRREIPAGSKALRLFGSAETGDPAYVIYIDVDCAKESRSEKILAAVATLTGQAALTAAPTTRRPTECASPNQ